MSGKMLNVNNKSKMKRNYFRIDPKKFFENLVEILEMCPMLKDTQSIGVIENFDMPDIKRVTVNFSIYDEKDLLREAINKSKVQG